MDKASLIHKMEEHVSSLRKLLEENEGSTIETLKSSAAKGFASVKQTFKENETAQKFVNEAKTKIDELEEAVLKGDKELSHKILGKIEQQVEKLKQKHAAAKEEQGGADEDEKTPEA